MSALARHGRLRVVLCAAVALGVLAPTLPASADPSISQLQSQATALRTELARLAVQQGLAVERYDAAQEALLQATTGEVQATSDLIDTQREVQRSRDDAARRVRAIYQSGGPVALTATMLDSGSLRDLMGRWTTLEGIVARDDRRVDQHQTTLLHQRQQTLAAGRSRASTAARQQVADLAAAQVTAAIAHQRELLARADTRVVALADRQRQQAEAAALARAVVSAVEYGIGPSISGASGSPGAGGATVASPSGRGLEGRTASQQQLPNVPAPSASAAAAIAAARTRLGMPYVWGATGPTTFDCSGLMLWSYAQAGVRLPRTSRAQYAGLPHVPLDQLSPGDLIFYATDVSNANTIHHVGMYVGQGLSLYAPQTGSFVKIGPAAYGRIIGVARPPASR